MVLALVALAAGCARQPASTDKAEIQKAVEQYLSTRPGLSSSAMETEVKDVKFQGDRAEAEVFFRSKTNPQANMTMRYALKRSGNAWVVEGARGGTGGAHSGMPGPDSGTAAPESMPNPRAAPPETAPAHPPPAGQAAKPAPVKKP